MKQKIALILGISGQCGSMMAELLLNKGYFVYGMKRRSSSLNSQRLDHIFDNKNLQLEYGDLADQASIDRIINLSKPDLLFNFAALSHVRVSFDTPIYTADITGTGCLRILESLRQYSPKTRFLQASSSEQFGGTGDEMADENFPMMPVSPYACAKKFAYDITRNYRKAYNMFAVNTINFNFESERRGETFVTRKITRAATRIKLGLQDKIVLGNISAKRDFSYCGDTIDAMYKAINHSSAEDWVVSSDENHTIEEFLKLTFSKLDLNYKDYLEIDEKYFRPSEVQNLLGCSAKIRAQLGWLPKCNFNQLIDKMVESDLALAEQELLIKNHKAGK